MDVYPAFVARGNPNSLYADDKLHLSAEGYTLWNKWARAAIADTSGCNIWKEGVCQER